MEAFVWSGIVTEKSADLIEKQYKYFFFIFLRYDANMYILEKCLGIFIGSRSEHQI